MAYPDTAELVAASSVPELTNLPAVQQDALRTEAILAIEGHAKQGFIPEGTTGSPVTRNLPSEGGLVLYLPKRLSALATVTFVGEEMGSDEVRLGDEHDRLYIPDERGGGTWATRALAADEFPQLHFPRGPGAVAVAGVWGWSDDEYDAELAAVTTALRYDMEDRALANAHGLSETVRSARALGLDDVSQGNLGFTLGDGEPAVSTRVQRVLVDLIWESAAGVLA